MPQNWTEQENTQDIELDHIEFMLYFKHLLELSPNQPKPNPTTIIEYLAHRIAERVGERIIKNVTERAAERAAKRDAERAERDAERAKRIAERAKRDDELYERILERLNAERAKCAENNNAV